MDNDLLIVEPETDLSVVLAVAADACVAARTAPKGKGRDLLVTAVLTGRDKKNLTAHMRVVAQREALPIFDRDADNIDSSAALLVFGSRKEPLGLKYCSLCGFDDCRTMSVAGGTCSFNTGDLGIALGSAVSRLADHRVDNRIMYTAGKAVVELGLLGDEVAIAYAVPISVTGKNPFFDRH